MALGVGLVLAAGQVFGVERFMWMGFACGSLLSEYPLPGSAAVRFWQRIAGAAAGCAAFALFYLALPAGLRPLLGPLGGFCMGFCTDYRYKTAMNCFGALMIGAGLYGLSGRWRCVWRTRCWARPSAFVSPRCSTGCRAAFCPRRTRRSESKHKTKTGAPLLAVRRFFGLFSEPCSRTLDYRGFLMVA